MPKLSVVVPVYKVEQYIHQCVDSILDQTFTDFEIILVDDGSPDKCGEICDEYTKKDSRVKVIHKKNGGLSDARNFGIDIAQGEYITFVDSDDKIDKYMYYDMLKNLEENDLDIICCDTYIVRGNNKKFRPRYDNDKIFDKNESIVEILNGNIDNAAWNKIYKRCLFEKIRYPKGRIYEDVATTYKLFYLANRVGYLKKPYYYYYKRKGSIVASAFNSKSRYDCFLGYKERVEFAIENKIKCLDECIKLAVETALSTLTAFYANNDSENSERFRNVELFIKEYENYLEKNKMKVKNRILLWGLNNANIINKVYAYISMLGKKLK